jgi:hypothetical protein
VLRVHASAGKLPIASAGLTIRVGKGGCGKATWLPQATQRLVIQQPGTLKGLVSGTLTGLKCADNLG